MPNRSLRTTSISSYAVNDEPNQDNDAEQSGQDVNQSGSSPMAKSSQDVGSDYSAQRYYDGAGSASEQYVTQRCHGFSNHVASIA